ncbi:hypothetical protein [Pseudonocardia acidicola]|uniref:hypothetical protein n=1 Tax=Pseudonocardia acidicola TaxID=2724939 RepID=UPI00146F7D55
MTGWPMKIRVSGSAVLPARGEALDHAREDEPGGREDADGGATGQQPAAQRTTPGRRDAPVSALCAMAEPPGLWGSRVQLGTPQGIDVDDTSQCIQAPACECCGGGSERLAVVTTGTDIGPLCLTMCDECRDAGEFPLIGIFRAVTRVLDHAGHLGVSVEDLAPHAARRAGPAGAGPGP